MLDNLNYLTFVVARDAESNVHVVQYNNPYPEELTKALEGQGATLLSHASLDLTDNKHSILKEVIQDLFDGIPRQDVCNFINALFEIGFRYGTNNYELLHGQLLGNPQLIITTPAVTDVPSENISVYYGVKKLENYEEFEKLIVRTGIQAALAANYNKLKFAKN